jgi:molybdate transport system regulatory protein
MKREMPMKISARNVLAGKIRSVTMGAVNAEVALDLEGGETVVSVITNSSAESLGLKTGGAAYAVIKASEVMIGVGIDSSRISARNVLQGHVVKVEEGAINSEVEVRLPGGTAIIASITKASVRSLELRLGSKVSAIVKASNVLVGV